MSRCRFPAFRLVNSDRDGRYRIERQIVADPHRDTLLQKVKVVSQQRNSTPLKLICSKPLGEM
ncbi:MAG: hypothetical protein ABI356_13225 [Steroidobacteraceae bacterium]